MYALKQITIRLWQKYKEEIENGFFRPELFINVYFIAMVHLVNVGKLKLNSQEMQPKFQSISKLLYFMDFEAVNIAINKILVDSELDIGKKELASISKNSYNDIIQPIQSKLITMFNQEETIVNSFFETLSEDITSSPISIIQDKLDYPTIAYDSMFLETVGGDIFEEEF